MINNSYRVSRLTTLQSILLLVLLLGACGCSNSQQETGPSNSGNASGKQSADRGVAEQATTEGMTHSASAASPLNGGEAVQATNGKINIFPEGVLAYPNAVHVESLRIASLNSEAKAPPGVVMFVSTETDMLRVANWYEKKLVSAGWEVVERSGDGENYVFQKAGKELGVSVTIIPDPKPDGHPDAHLLIVIDAS